MAEEYEVEWGGSEEESEGEEEEASEEGEETNEEEERAALAASQDGGGGEGQCPPHHKYNVMLTKFGGTRARGEELYEQNDAKAPVAIAIVLEAHEEEPMQWPQQRQTWEPVASWTQSSPIADPRGGRDDARDQKWITAGPYLNFAVVGRASRVAEIKKLEAETIAHKEGAQSRLLMVEAKFLQPMAGSSSVRLIAGHLHKTVAQKPNSADYIHFFNVLQNLCACGGRIFGADLNVALFNAEGEMAKRGVQITLLNHHIELEDPARPYDEGSVLHDSMGLFIVGPFDIPRTRIIPPEEHMFWGAAHSKEKTGKQCACGYLATSYVGQQPPAPKVFSLDGLNQALAEVQQAKREYERGNEECAQAFGIAPCNPVVLPHWFLRWREEQERRPELRFLDEHTMSGKVGINPLSQRRTFRFTDDFDPLPSCQEIIAKSRWWDTYGDRRGRGGRWPTIVSIDCAPNRWVAKREKRAAKIANARKRRGSSDGCAGGWRRQQASSSCEPYKEARGSGQPRRAQWWGGDRPGVGCKRLARLERGCGLE